jgi:glycosyltransferase involved in cell wall biosynthesis
MSGTISPTPISHEIDAAAVTGLTAPRAAMAQAAERSEPLLSRRQLKVLHLINGEHFAGAERVQQLLGERLPELGVEPDFVCLKPGRFTKVSGLPAERLIPLPMRSRFDLGVLRRLQQTIDQRRPDLLHAHTPRGAMLASWAAPRVSIPWVYHIHSPVLHDSTRPWINRINRWIEQRSLSNCRHLIAVSNSLTQPFLDRGWAPERMLVIPNGVPCQEPIDTHTRFHDPLWRLGVVALFRPRKGLEFLIDAVAQLLRDGRNIKLRVIGGFEDEAYRRQIKDQVRRLGLETAIEWVGFTTQVNEHLRQLDALVLPSRFGEGMPMVVLEALAVGLPVVATRVEGVPEVVRDGQEGFLADPENVDSLAHSLRRMTLDRQQWRLMSDRAWHRQRAAYSDHHMAHQTANLYRRILGTETT